MTDNEKVRVLLNYVSNAEEALYILKNFKSDQYEPSLKDWVVEPSVISNKHNTWFKGQIDHHRPWHVSVHNRIPEFGMEYQIGVIKYESKRGFVLWNLISLEERIITIAEIESKNNAEVALSVMAFFIYPELLEEKQTLVDVPLDLLVGLTDAASEAGYPIAGDGYVLINKHQSS